MGSACGTPSLILSLGYQSTQSPLLCCIANILHITHLVGHHQHPPDHRSRVLGLVYIKWHVRMDVQGCLCCVYFGVVRFDLLFSVVYVSCVDQVEPVSR